MTFLEWIKTTLTERDLKHVYLLINHVVQPLLMEVEKMDAVAQKLSDGLDALNVSLTASLTELAKEIADLKATPAPIIPATDEELTALEAKVAAMQAAVAAAVPAPAV